MSLVEEARTHVKPYWKPIAGLTTTSVLLETVAHTQSAGNIRCPIIEDACMIPIDTPWRRFSLWAMLSIGIVLAAWIVGTWRRRADREINKQAIEWVKRGGKAARRAADDFQPDAREIWEARLWAVGAALILPVVAAVALVLDYLVVK